MQPSVCPFEDLVLLQFKHAHEHVNEGFLSEQQEAFEEPGGDFDGTTVHSESHEVTRERSLNHQTVIHKVGQQLGVFGAQSLLQEGGQLLQLREPLGENLTPVVLDHDLVHAPEDLLLVLDVEEEEAHDIVHPLHVADLVVIVGVSHQDVVELIVSSIEISAISITLPELKLCHRPIYVFLNIYECCLVGELTQFLVHVAGVLASDGLDAEQLDPDAASDSVWDPMVNHRKADLLNLLP